MQQERVSIEKLGGIIAEKVSYKKLFETLSSAKN